MRIDKFLKVARILKRRTVAKELLVNNRVKINEKIAKPASDVKIGDIIEVQFGLRVIKVRVLDLKEFSKKADSDSLYEIIEERKIQDEIKVFD